MVMKIIKNNNKRKNNKRKEKEKENVKKMKIIKENVKRITKNKPKFRHTVTSLAFVN